MARKVMEITENQRHWCLNLIGHLFKWKLALFFRHPVDPEAEDLHGYFDRISRPMDLETVKKTLLDGNYLDVSSFLVNLRLIWQNAKTYYGPNTVMAFISDEILRYIDHEEQYVNLSAEQIWYQKLTEIQAKIEAQIQRLQD
jgi:hypothetical protein